MGIIKKIKEEKEKERKREEEERRNQIEKESHEQYIKYLAELITLEETIEYIKVCQRNIDTYMEVLALKVESH